MLSCIIVAAGSGSRMHAGKNKLLLEIENKTIIQKTIEQMLKTNQLVEMVIVISPKDKTNIANIVRAIKSNISIKIVLGGNTRQESVFAGLNALDYHDKVLIHDGARPFVTKELCDRVIIALENHKAVIPVVDVKDTIKVVNDNFISSTPARELLKAGQTPQGFDYNLICKAHKLAKINNFVGTDDASLVEILDEPVYVVQGDYKNIKLTTKEDLAQAQTFYKKKEVYMRIGYGYDIHKFKEGRPCILGGVLIDSPIGPDGHSDADVILHALMDALLGAAGLRDIGYYFPPNDNTLKNISSMVLLEKVVKLLQEKGYKPSNVDMMVIAETPKINPHIEAMKANISKVLLLAEEYISIKATTNEQMGALGRKEGIAAQAVAMIRESEE